MEQTYLVIIVCVSIFLAVCFGKNDVTIAFSTLIIRRGIALGVIWIDRLLKARILLILSHSELEGFGRFLKGGSQLPLRSGQSVGVLHNELDVHRQRRLGIDVVLPGLVFQPLSIDTLKLYLKKREEIVQLLAGRASIEEHAASLENCSCEANTEVVVVQIKGVEPSGNWNTTCD